MAARAASARPLPRPMENPRVPSGMDACAKTRPCVNCVLAGRSPVGSAPKSDDFELTNVGRVGAGASFVRTIRRACGSFPPPPGPSPRRPRSCTGRVTQYSTSSPSRRVAPPSTSLPWKKTRVLPAAARRAFRFFFAAAFAAAAAISLSYCHFSPLPFAGVSEASFSFSGSSVGSGVASAVSDARASSSSSSASSSAPSSSLAAWSASPALAATASGSSCSRNP
mmetsp:Transcript_11073/g.46517  ORF Transcript_11073/g.46517 Transcript_11073/m.46517 type:complete len:224 (-) Transcript_11073:551-1222(-)